MNQAASRALQWALAIGLVVLFLLLAPTSQLSRLPRVSWPWLVLLLVATTGHVLVSGFRWRAVAFETLGRSSLPLSKFIYYFLLGRVLGFVLPAEAADVGVRTLALRRSREFSLVAAAYTVLIDRLFDLVVLLCLSVPALLHLGGWLGEWTALGAGAAALGVLPFVVGRRYRAVIGRLTLLYAAMVRRLRFLPWARELAVPELEEGLGRAAFGSATAISIYALSTAKLLFISLRLWFVAGALGVPVPLWMAFLCVPLAQMAALAAVTPGGLGILEAGWYGILVWAGLAPEETVLLVVGWRLYTFASLLCLVPGLRIWEAAAARRG